MPGFGALGQFALGEGPVGGPFRQLNWTPAQQVRRVGTPLSVGLNLALIASLGPFVQKDWAPPKRAPRPVISLSSPQNLPLIASLGPFRQQDFTKPALPRGSAPQLASLNLNLIANLGPFSQTSWVAARRSIPSQALAPANVPLLVLQSTPFANFVFPAAVRAKLTLPVYPANVLPIISPVADTHDGVWVKKKRKRYGPDPIDLELAEKASRRAALELAIYGPEPSIQGQITPEKPVINRPPDITELAKTIFAVQQAQAESIRAQAILDDEDDLESILREIL